MLTQIEAIAEAIKAGASMDDIQTEANLQARHVGTVPFKNMIRALNMLTALNTQEDWTRLAGAMIAKSK